MSTNWLVAGIFFLIDVALCWWAWLQCFSKFKKATAGINDATAFLQGIPEDDYAARFEDIDKNLKKNSFLAESWKNFAASLTPLTENDRHALYSPMSASDFFRLGDITRAMNLSYWQNFGGIFTGIGIFGTFLGLVLGLWDVDFASSDIVLLKESIGTLLSGIYIAFLTSLFGIFCAIVYGFVHQKFIENLQKAVENFGAAAEKMYPCRTTEQWLAKSYEEDGKQTTQLQNIGQDTADALNKLFENQMGPAFDTLCQKLSDALDQKLSPVFDNLRNAIEGLNQNGIASIAQALGDSQKTTRQNNESILKAIEKINNMPQDMTAIFREQKQETAQMAKDIKEQTEGQLKALFDFLQKNQKGMEQNLSGAKDLTEQMTHKMNKALADFSSAMKSSLQESLQQQREASLSVSKDVGTRMGEQMEAFSNALSQVEGGMASTLKVLQDMNSDSTELTRTTMQGLSTALTRSAEEAARKQQAAADTMTARVANTVAEWSKKQTEVAAATESRVDGILMNLAMQTGAIIKQIKAIGAESQTNMQAYATQAKEAMEAAVASLQKALAAHNESMESARSRIEGICNTVGILVQKMNDSGNTFKNAAKPVEAATKELQDVLHKTTTEAKALHDTIGEQLQRLITHGEKSEMNFQNLTENLQAAEDRTAKAWEHYKAQFDKVSGELERSTQIVSERLAQYNETMSQGMQENFSTFAAKTGEIIGKLAGVVEEFNDMAENFTGKEPHKRGT